MQMMEVDRINLLGFSFYSWWLNIAHIIQTQHLSILSTVQE